MPFSTAGMYSLGIDAAHDLVLEDEALARLAARPSITHVRRTARGRPSAGRTALGLGLAADRLAVGHLRPPDVGLDLELAQQAVDDDLQMELAHARDDRLAGLVVVGDPERRILLGQPAPCAPILSWSALVFGSIATEITGSGKSIVSSTIGRFGVAERVAGASRLEADHGGDVARADAPRSPRAGWRASGAGGRSARVRPLRRVVDVHARLERAGIDAHERELADVRVGHRS